MKIFSAHLLLTLFISLPVLSQTKQKIDTLNARAYKIRSSYRDSSRVLAYEALKLSSDIDYNRGLGMAQLILGIHYCNTNRIDSASKYVDLGYSYFNSIKDKKYKAVAAWYKAKVYQKLNNFKRAYSYLTIAEDIFREQENYTYLIYILTEHGVYYEMQSNYSKALEYYLEVFKLAKGQSDEVNMRLNSNIASVYMRMDMLDEALIYAQDALQDAHKINSIRDVVEELYLIGSIYHKLGKDDSTKVYFEKSLNYARHGVPVSNHATLLLEIAKYNRDVGKTLESNKYLIEAVNLGVNYNLAGIYILLSQNYMDLEMRDSTLFYLLKAKSLAQERGSEEYMMSSYTSLMDFYNSSKQYDSAFFYSMKVIALSDSIYSENRDKRFDQLKVQLETLEKENEINALKFEQYESKIRNRIFTVVAVFLLLTTIIAFWVYRTTQRKKHQRLEHKKQQLEKQLELSQKKLSNHTLSMIQKNNVFEEIENELKGIRARCTGNIDPGLKKIQRDINLSRSLENDWSNFSNLFGEIHSTFFNYLEKNHSELSDYEMRLCALMKMKLTNKEIASMLNIEHKSVKMAKYRLKKKLGIGEDLSLSEYISTVD